MVDGIYIYMDLESMPSLLRDSTIQTVNRLKPNAKNPVCTLISSWSSPICGCVGVMFFLSTLTMVGINFGASRAALGEI